MFERNIKIWAPEKRNLIQGIKFLFSQDYFQNALNIWLIILNVVINIANWALLLIFIKPVDFSIILHYNVYFGVDVIGDWRKILFFPALGIFLFILNLSLAFHFYKQDKKIAAYLLMLVSLFAQLSLIISTATIILINY